MGSQQRGPATLGLTIPQIPNTYGHSSGAPVVASFRLREDGSKILREDGSKMVRE